MDGKKAFRGPKTTTAQKKKLSELKIQLSIRITINFNIFTGLHVIRFLVQYYLQLAHINTVIKPSRFKIALNYKLNLMVLIIFTKQFYRCHFHRVKCETQVVLLSVRFEPTTSCNRGKRLIAELRSIGKTLAANAKDRKFVSHGEQNLFSHLTLLK